MIIFGASVSPYVRKVIVACEEKGVAYDLRPVSLQNKPADFLAASPFGKMPAIQDGDFTISDSSVICVYLERTRPEPRLIPADAKEAARALWIEEMSDGILAAPVGTILFNRVVGPRFLGVAGDEAAVEKAIGTGLPPALDYLEKQLVAHPFLAGPALTLGDIAVTSQIVNLGYAGVSIDAKTHPKLAAHFATMRERPSFKAAFAHDARIMG